MAAPFSAIIMVGALVLPDVIVGITEASMTRNPSSPATRSRSSTTISGSLGSPILAVPIGWKMVVPMSPAAFTSAASSSFGGERNFASAFKLAVYSLTPVWLAGIFLLLPGLRFLALTGVYGIYVLSLGLPHMMKSPEARSPLYVAVIVACACLFIYAAAVVQRAIFGTAGF